MRASPWLPVMAVVCSVTCARDRPTPEASSLKPAHARALVDSVRAFALAIATDVTREGPGAWQGDFARSPAFFMAAEGRVVFPSRDTWYRGAQAGDPAHRAPRGGGGGDRLFHRPGRARRRRLAAPGCALVGR